MTLRVDDGVGRAEPTHGAAFSLFPLGNEITRKKKKTTQKEKKEKEKEEEGRNKKKREREQGKRKKRPKKW